MVALKKTTLRNGNGDDTKAALLNAAERLFATDGFNATSLRAITDTAGANLGAVNYHFRSKDDLILAVLQRRLRPINDDRLTLLSRFEKQAGKKPAPIEKILEALFRPPIDLATDSGKSGEQFVRLMAHSFADPGAFLRPLIEEEFGERNRRFHAAVKRALPYLSSDEIHWRLHFANGVFLHTIANSHVLELSSGGRCRVGNSEKVLQKMIAFCAAGFEARREGKGRK
jgi:AcrR family transcriptional regulator